MIAVVSSPPEYARITFSLMPYSDGFPSSKTYSPEKAESMIKEHALLSLKDAEKKVASNKLLYIGSSVTPDNSFLYDSPSGFLWVLTYKSTDDASLSEYGPEWSRAIIDAVTGDLVYFSSPCETGTADDKVLSKKKCLKKAEKFLKSVTSECYAECELSYSYAHEYARNDEGLFKSIYYFEYTREHDGIPVVDDGLAVYVDRSSGKVTYFEKSWHDYRFEKAENLISKDEALSELFEGTGLTLTDLSDADDIPVANTPVYVYKNKYDDNGDLISSKTKCVYRYALERDLVRAVSK